jgi:hypothetical protein
MKKSLGLVVKGVTLLSLPNDFRIRLVDELRLAVNKMSEAQSPEERLYYFSVFFGEAVRILNWHWDATIALIWSNVQHTHNVITARVQAFARGDRVVVLSEEFFKAVTQTATELVDFIETQGDEAELCRILARFAELTYATTGNGYYLLGKGHIKL